MKKVVIAGSAKLQNEIQKWIRYWEGEEFEVLNYPSVIPKETFEQEYPQVFADFFRDMERTDVLFVMNEDKNGIQGYVGAESFAEMAFCVAQKLVHGSSVKIVLLQRPSKEVQSYDELMLWLKLGWIELHEASNVVE